MARGFVSEIDVSNISPKPLSFKENVLRQFFYLDIGKSIYQLLGSFIVQIYKVKRSQKEQFLVCFHLNSRGGHGVLTPTGESTSANS